MDKPPINSDRLANFDFARHNAEVKELWTKFNAWHPTRRIPIILGLSTRYHMFNRAANPDGLDFRRYSEDPDVMFDAQLRFQRWRRFNILQDAELGFPDKWVIGTDFQNYLAPAWFGCRVHYFPDQVPDTMPDFADAPERVMEKGIPDPFGGIMARALAYWEHFHARAQKETFLGLPIEVPPPVHHMAGPMTISCCLFGAEFVCETMAEDPERLHRLLDFVTEATLQRVTAWRKFAGLPLVTNTLGYGDDSLALISTAMYREHILPYHRRLCEALSTPGAKRSIHLCGDATRHFRTLRDELNIRTFDTGFPVDFGAIRRELGPDVRIQGGPHVQFMVRATPAEIDEEVHRILQTGIMDGGFFVLREGNNLAPETPLENSEALYHAGRKYGQLSAS